MTDWKPDIIISDPCMPEHDSYWLMESVRSLNPQDGGTTPAIAVTARIPPEERRRASKSGFQVFLPKPFETNKLISAVRQLAAR